MERTSVRMATLDMTRFIKCGIIMVQSVSDNDSLQYVERRRLIAWRIIRTHNIGNDGVCHVFDNGAHDVENNGVLSCGG